MELGHMRKSGRKVIPKIKKWTSTKSTFCLKLFQMTPMSSLREYDRKRVWNQLWQASHQYLHGEIQGSCYTRPTGSHWKYDNQPLNTRGGMIHALGLDQWRVPKEAWKVQRLLNTLVTNGHVVMVGWGQSGDCSWHHGGNTDLNSRGRHKR